jgi:hypothetical protein
MKYFLGSLHPNNSLRTGHGRHMAMAGHATGTVDPLLPVANGRS